MQDSCPAVEANSHARFMTNNGSIMGGWTNSRLIEMEEIFIP
jgi:hypothetical protein